MSLSFRASPFPSMPIISSFSHESVGRTMNLANSLPVSTAWTTANQARYVPFWIAENITVVKLLAYNGATAAGNTDIGIYDAAGTEIVGIAAAAQTGTAVWQEFNITDTPLVPGLYYIGLLNTTTTGTYYSWGGTIKEVGRMAGVFSQAVGAGTLPSPTATFAALDFGLVPIVAMSTRVLI